MPMVIAVVGPTASGKSELAVRLARELDGEVVNADSMQLYQGMDIGTGKLTLAERGGVPHHLLGIWDVAQTASVSVYQRLAHRVIAEVSGRGRTPILVGGSGLYVRSAIDDLEFPGTDPVVRERLEAELVRLGPGALHARLAAADPAAGVAILPSNGRRIVRALEVMELTGRPFTATLPAYREVRPSAQIGLAVSRRVLDQRIADRVQRMWRDGLVEEVERLAGAGLRSGRTASRALGYSHVLAMLDGQWSRSEAMTRMISDTRRFARRQESWFRRDPRVRWLPADLLVPTELARSAIGERDLGAG